MNRTIRIALAAVLALTPALVSADVHNVTVAPLQAFEFLPAHITIEVGDTVHWEWEGGLHNVASGPHDAPTEAFLSGPPAGIGTMFEVVFDQAFLDANPVVDGLHDYHCQPHGFLGMIGSVTVNVTISVDDTSWGGIKALYR